MAVLLLTVGTLAVLQALGRGIQVSGEDESTRLGLRLAESRLETLRTVSFASLANTPAAQDPDFPEYQVGVQVTGTEPKQVTVTVTRAAHGGDVNVQLSTLRANV